MRLAGKVALISGAAGGAGDGARLDAGTLDADSIGSVASAHHPGAHTGHGNRSGDLHGSRPTSMS